jgi:hypothetical protein
MPLAFRECAQAFDADVHVLGNAIFGDGHFLDIRLPLMLGSLIGMADVLSKLNALATDVTLSHVYSLLNNVRITVYIIPQQAAFCKSVSRWVSNESRVTLSLPRLLVTHFSLPSLGGR